MNLNKIIKESLKKVLKEAEDQRDAYTDVIGMSGNYEINNAQDLSRFLRDPNRQINKNAFVNMVYVSECATVKKTFQNGGYTDNAGNSFSASDIEQMGRSMGKKYLNGFFDSDEYQKKLSKTQGAKMGNFFALFTVTIRRFNWSCNNYDERQKRRAAAIDNATDAQLNDFTGRDSQFSKRLKAFVAKNPDMADEIQMYIDTNSFPREIVHKIQGTKLNNGGAGWEKDGYSPFVSTHEKTGNEALRVTISKNIEPIYKNFIVLKNGDVRNISTEEYEYLKKAFGTPAKSTSDAEAMTELREILNAIADGDDDFRNWNLPNIAKLSFSVNGKRIVYRNHEMNVGGITIDADDLLNAPMSENRMRMGRLIGEGRRGVKPMLSEDAISRKIRRIIRENLRRR